jgi:rod shape-determining protein MreB and related proteins
MLQSLFSKITSDLLVEITQEELRVYSFSNDTKYIDEPLIAVEVVDEKESIKAIGRASRNCIGPGIKIINPFNHNRSIISSFTYAEKILQFAFKSIQTNAFKAAPRVVMHQLEKNEGGLTETEERLLRELAIAAGAREVVVYQGNRIIPEHETFENIKARANAT